MSRTEYIDEKCPYGNCKKKTLRYTNKLRPFRHIKDPKTFKYLICDTCGRYACIMNKSNRKQIPNKIIMKENWQEKEYVKRFYK